MFLSKMVLSLMKQEINKIIPIIDFLIREKSKIIIISHVGRPKGEVNKILSLKPICESLEKKKKRKKLNYLTKISIN